MFVVIFESVFEKRLCLGKVCNDSRLYKNAYKELCLLKMFQLKVFGVKNVFIVSKRATRSESTHSKGLRCSFPPPLDVVISP